MGGHDFKAAASPEQENEAAVSYNTYLGIILFCIYTIFYGGFMLLSAFKPDLMGTPSLGGLNLSITFGFALIAFALVLALLYLAICKKTNIGGDK